LFPFLHKLFGNKKVALLCCAGFLFVGSMLGIFISNPYALGYASLTITGIGKAFYFAFASFYIIDLVGEKNLPIALTLSSGVANMAATLLNLASTSVYGAWGFEGYFGLATGLEAIGILFLLLSRPQREETAAA
ncbi:MAG: MFS transporter, partial [Bacilli bacterium]|nr:MFS transporter [Bacilli bacterium]